MPIFSEKKRIVVFEMNWIYAVVLLKDTFSAIAILIPYGLQFPTPTLDLKKNMFT